MDMIHEWIFTEFSVLFIVIYIMVVSLQISVAVICMDDSLLHFSFVLICDKPMKQYEAQLGFYY